MASTSARVSGKACTSRSILRTGVEHRRVVAVAEEPADLGKWLAGLLSQEVHGDVSGGGDAFAARLAAQGLRRDGVERAYGVDDSIGRRRDRRCRRLDDGDRASTRAMSAGWPVRRA